MNENFSEDEPKKRKFLGIMFKCCNVYGRIYQNKMGTAYVGRCPKCMRSVRVNIDSSSDKSTSRRFFSAD